MACRRVTEPSLLQNLGEISKPTVNGVPLSFLHKQVEVLLRGAVVAAKVQFCLVPEILDPIAIIGLLRKQFQVLDSDKAELGNVEHVKSS